MTTERKRNLLIRIGELQKDIQELRNARLEAASNGYASATLSSSGGSKSYTRLTPEQIS